MSEQLILLSKLIKLRDRNNRNPSVNLLTDNPVNRIMVIKRDEGKPSLLITVLFGHDVDGLNLTKLYEVVP